MSRPHQTDVQEQDKEKKVQEFLAAIMAFPTAVFTVLLGFVLLYWFSVILGVLDLDFLDSLLGLDAAEGALDGAVETLEGAAEGALEGVGEALDGVDGALEGGAEAGEAGAADTVEGARGLLHALGVQGVPITFLGSFIIFWAWVISFFVMQLIGGPAASGAMGAVIGIGVAFFGVAAGVVLGALCVRPLSGLCKVHQAPGRASLVGKMCTVTSLRVDASSGQAEIDNGGAGVVAEVRCLQTNDLVKGSQALVFKYDASKEVFHIGPVDRAITEVERLTTD